MLVLFKNILLNEFVKTIRQPLMLLLVGLYPLAVFLNSLYYNIQNIDSKSNYSFSKFFAEGHLWQGIHALHYTVFSILYFLVVNLVVYLVFRIEIRNNGWKYLDTLPLEKDYILGGKIAMCLLYSGGILLLCVCIHLLFAAQPDMHFELLLRFCLQLFIYSVAAISIQAVLCCLTNNQTVLLVFAVMTPFLAIFEFFTFGFGILPHSYAIQDFFMNVMRYQVQFQKMPPLLGYYEIASLAGSAVVLYLFFKLKQQFNGNNG